MKRLFILLYVFASFTFVYSSDETKDEINVSKRIDEEVLRTNMARPVRDHVAGRYHLVTNFRGYTLTVEDGTKYDMITHPGRSSKDLNWEIRKKIHNSSWALLVGSTVVPGHKINHEELFFSNKGLACQPLNFKLVFTDGYKSLERIKQKPFGSSVIFVASDEECYGFDFDEDEAYLDRVIHGKLLDELVRAFIHDSSWYVVVSSFIVPSHKISYQKLMDMRQPDADGRLSPYYAIIFLDGFSKIAEIKDNWIVAPTRIWKITKSL